MSTRATDRPLQITRSGSLRLAEHRRTARTGTSAGADTGGAGTGVPDHNRATALRLRRQFRQRHAFRMPVVVENDRGVPCIRRVDTRAGSGFSHRRSTTPTEARSARNRSGRRDRAAHGSPRRARPPRRDPREQRRGGEEQKKREGEAGAWEEEPWKIPQPRPTACKSANPRSNQDDDFQTFVGPASCAWPRRLLKAIQPQITQRDADDGRRCVICVHLRHLRSNSSRRGPRLSKTERPTISARVRKFAHRTQHTPGRAQRTSSVGGFKSGIKTGAQPAACAARRPGPESSSARQRSGAKPTAAAAFR